MRLRVITPVHIGDGEEIIPWSYEVKENLLKVYSLEELMRELAQILKGEELKSTLIALKEDMRIHGFSKNLGEFLAERKIKPKEAYSLRLQTRLKVRDNYKPVKSFIKTRGKVYIPGSEVKGALRTVFMFGVIREELKRGNSRLYEKIKGILIQALQKHDIPPRKKWEQADRGVERLIMRYGRSYAHDDLFKALLVSDSELREPSECLFVGGVRLVNSSRRFTEPHELLTEGTTFTVSIRIDEAQKRNLGNPFGKYLTLEKLREFSLDFYGTVLKRTELFCRERNIPVSSLNEIRRLLQEGKFVLRIGKHQGFLSVGILGILLENGDEELYKKVYRTVVPRYSVMPNKTLKLTEDGRPLGWVVLE